jgi:acetylornithine deacetylase
VLTHDPANLPALVQAMVAYDTRNGVMTGRAHAERELAQYLEGLAQAWGLLTRRLVAGEGDFNLLVYHEVSDTAPWLLCESHLDTVGVEGMTIEPFAGRITEGRIWGRGACDTKASGAAMLWALRRYAQASAQPNNVALLFSVDEEATKAGVIAYVREHLPALGWKPSGAIVGEPTELKPVVAHAGVVRWSIRTHGLAAHSSDPSRGRSAISLMMRVVDALESRYIPALRASHPLVGRAQCSINIIHGGTQTNIIPDLCEIWLDRRLVPGEDPVQVLPAVTAVLEALRAEYPTLAYSMTEPYIDAPLDPAGGEALARWVQGALRARGLPTALCGAGYGTDASTLRMAGIPAVVLGPGHIAQAHTRDEWLDLAQLDQAAELYLSLMQSPLGKIVE